MNLTPDTASAENGGGNFDPRQAAALLDQTVQTARRTFASGPPLLWLYRAFFVLVAFGGFWLSVRGQQPYVGPRGWSLPLAAVLIAINILWSVLILRRAGTGVSGPAQRARQSWIGVMLLVWILAYAITAPLYHAGAGHPVWGLYPASAPLMIVGLIGAISAAAMHDRATAGTLLAITLVAAAAGFGGPVSSWLIMGIGLSAACLGTAVFKFRQQRQGVFPS
jgi:hypothetical protein